MSSVRVVLKRIAYAGIFFVSGVLALSWPTTADANGGKGGGRSGASSRRATRTQGAKRAASRTRSRTNSRSSAARSAARTPRSRAATAGRSRATKAAPQAASRNNRPASDSALARPGADGIARLSDGSWLGSSPNSSPASPGSNRPTPSVNRTPNINPANPNKPGTGVTRLADGSLRFPLYNGRPGGAQSLQGMVRIEPPSDSGAPRRWSYRGTSGQRNWGYLEQPAGRNIGPGLFFEGDSTSMDDLVGTADPSGLDNMDRGDPGRIQFRSASPAGNRRWYGGSMGLGANQE